VNNLAKESTTFKEIDIHERIEEQKKILSRQFTQLDNKTKKVVGSLIDNAAFMMVTLQDLAATIKRDGVVSEYQNGASQWGTKKSPEVEVYNSMIKNHVTIMKKLADLLPKGNTKTPDDPLDDFVNKRS
jgi:hypothetical protein